MNPASLRILLINGHPGEQSLSRSLLDSYGDAANGAGYEVRRHDFENLQFDMDFGQSSYRSSKPLETMQRLGATGS